MSLSTCLMHGNSFGIEAAKAEEYSGEEAVTEGEPRIPRDLPGQKDEGGCGRQRLALQLLARAETCP